MSFPDWVVSLAVRSPTGDTAHHSSRSLFVPTLSIILSEGLPQGPPKPSSKGSPGPQAIQCECLCSPTESRQLIRIQVCGCHGPTQPIPSTSCFSPWASKAPCSRLCIPELHQLSLLMLCVRAESRIWHVPLLPFGWSLP